MTPPRRSRAGVAAALLWLVGCPHAAPPAVVADPDLAEAPDAAQDPVAVLVAARRSERDDLRARAWSVPTTAAAAAELAVGLQDPSPWVQGAVVRALARIGGDDARAALAGAAADRAVDPYVRAEAALGAGGAAGAEALRGAWAAEPLPHRRLPLAFAALRLGDASARAEVEGILAAGELPLEPAFFLTLSAAPDAGLATALAAAQDRVEEELAGTVAAARMRLGDPSAEQVLRTALADPEEELRLEVVDLLVDVPGPEADALLQRAQREGPALVARYAELVSLARARRDAGPFARAMEDPEWEVRQLAVRFAARAVDPLERSNRAWEKVIEAGLADPSGLVRTEAADAAAQLRLTGTVPVLERLLGADPGDGTVAVAAALVSLRGS